MSKSKVHRKFDHQSSFQMWAALRAVCTLPRTVLLACVTQIWGACLRL
jgi:hypothetical protein